MLQSLRQHCQLYKPIAFFIMMIFSLEYLFIIMSERRNASFNSTRAPYNLDTSASIYDPFINILKHEPNETKKRKHVQSMNDYNITFPTKLLKLVENNKENITEESNKMDKKAIPPCPDIPQYLYGKVKISKYPIPSIESLEKRFSWLHFGGHWAPENCKTQSKIAIVVPYRSRGENLLLFLQHMHPFLKKQQVDYRIYVIEQEELGPFNRAMLLNIGYVEALKIQYYDCFIFHDVDLLPEDDRNLYSCPQQPRHMSVAVDVLKYKLPYPAIFGGVSAISTSQFKLLNGFSNSFWGWGGEDDDISNRIRYHHLYISRYPTRIARYTMLDHKKNTANPSRYDILKKGQKYFDTDGLNSLNYKLMKKKQTLLYTWIMVRLFPPKIIES